MRWWGQGRILRIIPLLAFVPAAQLIVATGKKSIDATTVCEGDLDGAYVRGRHMRRMSRRHTLVHYTEGNVEVPW